MSDKLSTARGEYKQPGGKLTAVRVWADGNGRLRRVEIDGDYFVEADSQHRIDAFFDDLQEGLLRGASLSVIASGYRDVHLIGSSLEAIEIAFERACQLLNGSVNTAGGIDQPIRSTPAISASGDDDVVDALSTDSLQQDTLSTEEICERWAFERFVLLRDDARSASEQMAIDEQFAREVADGKRPATVRIWRWAEKAVVVGRFQSIEDEVNTTACAEHSVAVVRRCTGGGAMYIDPANVITFSIYAPARFTIGLSVEQTYTLCNAWVIDTLRDLGVPAQSSGLNDISTPSGKIGGAAQRRFAAHHPTTASPASSDARNDIQTSALLHHVTMAYAMNRQALGQYLIISREKMKDKAVRSVVRRVDPICRYTNRSFEQVLDHLQHYALHHYGCVQS